MLKDLHFHSHRNMEKAYKIPLDHVIVDRSSYDKIMELIKIEVRIEETKEAYNKRYKFDKPLIRLYPNKFKVISNLKQIDEPGLYYFNDSMPDGLVEPVSKWIADILNSRPQYFNGYKNTSITEIDFVKKYGYPVGKLNYKQDVCLAKREHLFSQGVNPLRIHQKPGTLPNNISLWGSYLRGIELQNCNYVTVEFAAVLMSVFDMLFSEGEQRALDYLTVLKQREWVYSGDQHRVYTNLVQIQHTKVCEYYIMDLDKKEDIKRDFEYLKKHLIRGE